MLAVFSIALSSLGDRMAEIVSNMGNPRGILRWLGDQSLPQQRSLWISLLGYLAGVMAPALTLWWVVRRLLRPVIAMLERRASDVWWKRIPFAVAHLVLLVAPIAAFVAVGYAMLAVLRPPTDARLLLITTLLTAVGIALACNAIAKTLLAPLAPALRPMPMRNEAAAYLYVWIRRFVDLSVYGYFLTQATLLVGVPPGAYAFLARLIGLLLALLFAVLILQNRMAVQHWMAYLGGDRVRPAAARVVRERLAGAWHILALLYVAATWAVWMLGIPGGFTLIARNTLATATIVTITWLIVRLVRRAVHRAFGVSEEIDASIPSSPPGPTCICRLRSAASLPWFRLSPRCRYCRCGASTSWSGSPARPAAPCSHARSTSRSSSASRWSPSNFPTRSSTSIWMPAPTTRITSRPNVSARCCPSRATSC